MQFKPTVLAREFIRLAPTKDHTPQPRRASARPVKLLITRAIRSTWDFRFKCSSRCRRDCGIVEKEFMTNCRDRILMIEASRGSLKNQAKTGASATNTAHS